MPASPCPRGNVDASAPGLVERLRTIHPRMVEAVLGGDGLEYLHLAAVASMTQLAIERAKEEVEQTCAAPSSRACAPGPTSSPGRSSAAPDVWAATSRAEPLCCAPSPKPTVRGTSSRSGAEYDGALAQHMEDRIYASLPAVGADAAPEETLARARRLAEAGAATSR